MLARLILPIEDRCRRQFHPLSVSRSFIMFVSRGPTATRTSAVDIFRIGINERSQA